MSTVKVIHEVTIGGVTVTNNELLAPTTLTDLTSLDFCVRDITVAISSTSQVLWSTGNGVTTFLRGLLITDQDIWLELRNDNGTAEYALIEAKANQPTWFGGEMGADTTESLDGAVLVDGTDYDDVDRIEVQNDGSTAATVSLFLFN